MKNKIKEDTLIDVIELKKRIEDYRNKLRLDNKLSDNKCHYMCHALRGVDLIINDILNSKTITK